jgi:hypothetical protein
MIETLPSWLGWAIALGLLAFVLGFMLISRDARLETNVSALVFGEPGVLGLGVGLLAAGAATDGPAGPSLVIVGVVLAVLANLSWFTEVVSI